MSVSLLKSSFAGGEISPSLWGQMNYEKVMVGASVMRNCFVNYRGPASSRAGTMLVGQMYTPASASSLPPAIRRFQFNIYQSYILEFGADSLGRTYMRVATNGAYVTDTTFNVTAASKSNPCQLTVPGNNYANNDWVVAENIGGMTQLDGRTFVVSNVNHGAGTFTLSDTFGNPVNSLAYSTFTAGGTVARIYTNFSPPYALADLPYLKITQSADVMTLDCVNQQTGTEYPPTDLKRLAANNWEFDQTTFVASIVAPASCTASATVTGSPATQYAFCVTAIDATTGEESIASPVAYVTNSVDIALTAGSLVVTWATVPNASSYNIYQAPPSYDTAVPVGTAFGFIGQSTGNQFVNNNIVPDMTRTPPLHLDPFARGSIQSLAIVNPGSGYIQATTTVAVNTLTGSGAVLIPVVVGGAVVAIIVQNGGKNYAPPDTVAIAGQGTGAGATGTYSVSATDGAIATVTLTAGGSRYVSPTVTAPGGSGAVFAPIVVGGVITAIYIANSGSGYVADNLTITDTAPAGTGATATLVLGPGTGTYPSVPGYFQERRVYANTLNNPDTEYYSQTGAFTNMDASDPPIDSDAIVLTPWGQQVNGVQWIIPMNGGLISATGLGAWLVSGASGSGSTLTPSSESAQPQEAYGFSPTVQPLKINYDIVYSTPLSNSLRDIQFDFYSGAYVSSEISILSNHLFQNFRVIQMAWAKEPYKLIWATRDDGKFLSVTYLKEEKLIAVARHDTNGLVVGNEVATEPPVDAAYFIVKRFIIGENQWAYFLERMDNRLWEGPEDPWCVDCAVALEQTAPNATLSTTAAQGPGNITGGYVATGGQGYTNPAAEIIDPTGLGSGGSVTLVVAGGVITGLAVTPGENYPPTTQCKITDPTGAGASVILFISQNVLFQASAAVFGATQINDVIRIGGGQATVSNVVSPSVVNAAITVPILQTVPNDPNKLPVPAAPGDWTITTPVTAVTGLDHLEGMQVTGLADGEVIPLTTVVGGSIPLPNAASSVVVGLPFIAQLQAMHVEINPTAQGKRKTIVGATLRMEKSKGVEIGADQPVASTLDFQQEIPWANLSPLNEYANSDVPAAALPLFTGDKFAPCSSGWQNWNLWEDSPGFVCAQQSNPLPMNVLAFVPRIVFGDSNT